MSHVGGASSKTAGGELLNNTLLGTGYVAIDLLGGTTRTKVVRNDVTGFAATGPADILLNPRPSDNVVVCATAADTVSDLGTGNQVVGCALQP